LAESLDLVIFALKSKMTINGLFSPKIAIFHAFFVIIPKDLWPYLWLWLYNITRIRKPSQLLRRG